MLLSRSCCCWTVFDELLGHASDYVLKLAGFSKLEAEPGQGRPVMVLLTSRIQLADRVRYPDGTIALPLEPFRDDQIASWLRIWNACNEQLITSRGLKPLTAGFCLAIRRSRQSLCCC